jgi:hypothetical protein
MTRSMIAPSSISVAIHYLRSQGEVVEPSGLGLWRVNGEIQSADQMVAYADDLRAFDCLQPCGVEARRPVSKGRLMGGNELTQRCVIC